ncbi:MAG: hypothetical protein CM1200mP2_37380 [Planctomycetaceae bacterium]|nr:MAG: hypothetical protein CM1200mP2_37380 [Planctomycetaceae bacterium]
MKWVPSDGNGSYVIGQFDGTRFRTEQKKEALDYGFNFYATQTWSDVPKEMADASRWRGCAAANSLTCPSTNS